MARFPVTVPVTPVNLTSKFLFRAPAASVTDPFHVYGDKKVPPVNGKFVALYFS